MAGEIGYPIALKAAGGGGGRGIRIVHDESSLEGDYRTAAREASGAFGDERLYVERFVVPARHVEVQVLGDGESTIHLHERDCSLQRRRQKVLEETPRAAVGSRHARPAVRGGRVAVCGDQLSQRRHG